MKAIPLLVAAALPLAACSDPATVGVAGVRELNASQVANCTHQSNFTMEPGLYGPVLGGQGLRHARNRILQDAAASGANAVVFEPVVPGSDVYLVRAAAYRC